MILDFEKAVKSGVEQAMRECELTIGMTLKEAVEKQIPKKPIKANRIVRKDGLMLLSDDNEYWKCPICTLYDVPLRQNQRYCHYCGQALEWGDEYDR